MITVSASKLDVYEKFDSDIDRWIRLPGHAPERALMSEHDWRLIEELLNRVRLYGSGLTAESFDAETDRLLAKHIADPAALERLRSLAHTRGR